MIAWQLFYHPVLLPFDSLVWLVLPLCASVSIIYKTLRTDSLRALPVQILGLFAYMVVGLAALGIGLWLLQEYWPT